jgi:hypothetical protein
VPSFILKVDREQDLYVEWSTVVDNACRAGTRAEMLEALQREEPRGYTANPGNAPEDRMRRADETGTSALWPSSNDPFGGWNDQYLMVEQRGLLPRERLSAYLDAHFDGDQVAAHALLRHFEDCECADCLYEHADLPTGP